MDADLKKAIINAVKKNATCISNHVMRGKENKNDHSSIDQFQHGICASLNKIASCGGICIKCNKCWSCEYKPSDDHKDSIDIYNADSNGSKRQCIIEIDAVRHDQVAAKFVSRVALCGINEPIDYVAILYRSTQKSGKQTTEKFIRYTYDILKKLNPESSLLGIYVDVLDEPKNNPKVNVEIWDCTQQVYTITNEDCMDNPFTSMPECAEGVLRYYLKKNPDIDFDKLKKEFHKGRGGSYVFESAETANAKAKYVEDLNIYIETQFRAEGTQANWKKFCKLCKDKGIMIEQQFKQPKDIEDPFEISIDGVQTISNHP